MRTSVVAVSAALTLSAIGLVPASASPVGGACAWHATEVAAPKGHEARFLTVTGADGRGDYSGYHAPTSADIGFIRWHNGIPEVQKAPPGAEDPLPRDENGSGTVALTALRPGGERAPYLQRRDGTYQALPVPPGLADAEVVAVNDRGDAVGNAVRTTDNRRVVVLWPHIGIGPGPVVLDPPELPYPVAIDLDEDGSLLLGGGYDAYLWRTGTLTKLPEPRFPTIARGLAGGLAVGMDLNQPTVRAWLWDTVGGKVGYLDRSGIAESVNRHGLVAGATGGWQGTPAVWRQGVFEAQLPLPKGATSAQVRLAGADGAVYGETSNPKTAAVRWNCV